MRADIDAAYWLLEGSGRNAIDGLRALAAIKRGFQKLEEFLPDERVLAIATGFDPELSQREKLAMGGAAGMRATLDQAKSGRLLVLTEVNFYEVAATGRLNGNRPQGVRIRLADVSDVRVRTERKLTRKDRFLMIDHMRGAELVTKDLSRLGGGEPGEVSFLERDQSAREL